MNEEEKDFTLVSTVKRQNREKQYTIQEMYKKAKAEGLYFCFTCANRDYVKGQLKDYKEYCKDMNVVKKKNEFDRITHEQNGETIDYVCPLGHKGSYMYLFVKKDGKYVNPTEVIK